MEGSVIGCETALKIAKHSGNYHQKATQMRQRGLFCVLCQFKILLLRDIFKISHVSCSWRFSINPQNTSKIFCAAYVNVDTRPLAHSIVWGCAGQRWAHPLPDGPVTTFRSPQLPRVNPRHRGHDDDDDRKDGHDDRKPISTKIHSQHSNTETNKQTCVYMAVQVHLMDLSFSRTAYPSIFPK